MPGGGVARCGQGKSHYFLLFDSINYLMLFCSVRLPLFKNEKNDIDWVNDSYGNSSLGER